MTNQFATDFTNSARQHLSLEIERHTGITPSESQLTAYFNGISHFQPDGSAHVELGSGVTLSKTPIVIEFTAEDFKYAE